MSLFDMIFGPDASLYVQLGSVGAVVIAGYWMSRWFMKGAVRDARRKLRKMEMEEAAGGLGKVGRKS